MDDERTRPAPLTATSSTPFGEETVTISMQELIQLKCDANRLRGICKRHRMDKNLLKSRFASLCRETKAQVLQLQQELEKERARVLWWKKRNERLEKGIKERDTWVQHWKQKFADTDALASRLEQELEEAQAQVSQFRKMEYGTSSERQVGDGKKPEDDGNDAPKPGGDVRKKRKRGAQPGSSGNRRTNRDNLLHIPRVWDVPLEQRICGCCGKPYAGMSWTEDSETVEYHTVAFVTRHKRKKYVRTCQCEGAERFVTAARVPKVIPRGSLGHSAWVEILLSKFQYGCPTGNLVRQMASHGLAISEGTVAGGLKKLSPLFGPVLAALYAKQMGDGVFHCDETGWRVHEKVGGKTGNRWYLWEFASSSAVTYQIESSRSGDVPIGFFGSLSGKHEKVVVVCDRYSGYKRLAGNNKRIILAFCWAHMRRDFINAATGFAELESWKDCWLNRIRKLYRLNRRRLKHWDRSRPLAGQNARFMRAQRSLEQAVAMMQKDFEEELSREGLHPAQDKVLRSLIRHWSGLTVFADRPDVPMDNNLAERLLRSMVVLRKTCNGSGSVWGAELAARMFSIIQTLSLWGLNPRRWLHDYLDACARAGGQAPSCLDAFLPWKMSEERFEELSAPLDPMLLVGGQPGEPSTPLAPQRSAPATKPSAPLDPADDVQPTKPSAPLALMPLALIGNDQFAQPP